MTSPGSEHDEEALASLLSELREPPRAWIQAAKELPTARSEIARIVERAKADAEFRAEVLRDLESALAAEGHEPTPQAIAALKASIACETTR